MTLLLVFGVTLLVAALLSELASRSILSTAVVFLAAGFIAGEGGFGWIRMEPGDPMLGGLAELALFSILFTDGMRVGIRDLARAWKLPGRALLVGMPMTMGVTAVVAWWLADLTWAQALLVGAVLAPTDPVFAAALVGREEVPLRLRRLLNVESGVNDGLALPFVLVFLALAGGGHADPLHLGWELALGIGLGVAVPWAAIRLEGSRLLAARKLYEPILTISIAVILYALTGLTHANRFLAAFAAGVTIASVSPRAVEEFHRFGEVLAELLKLAALLLFGALLAPSLFADIGWQGWVFALLAILLARPLAVTLALWGSPLDAREILAAGWFGPKGFASVVYALLIYESGAARAEYLLHLLAAVVVLSMVAHSSTDVLVARWFHRAEEEEVEEG